MRASINKCKSVVSTNGYSCFFGYMAWWICKLKDLELV